jgi:solute carrier family 30 (zinc transporter), member 2
LNKKTIVFVYLGGVLSNSTAVATDATHMGIDVASFVISLSAMYLSTKQPTGKLSYGYARAGLLF